MLLMITTAQTLGFQMFSMINIDEILNFAEVIIYTHTGKYLNDLQRVILQVSLSRTKKTYEQIANEYGYSENYIQQVVATKLWKLLSEGLGEKVSKANVRSVLERNIPKYSLIHSQKNTKKRILLVYPHQEPIITLVQTFVSALSITDYQLVLKTWESWPDTELLQQQSWEELSNSDYLILFLSQEFLISAEQVPNHNPLMIQSVQQALALNQTNDENKAVLKAIVYCISSNTSIDHQLSDHLRHIPQWKWSCPSDTPRLIEEIFNYLKIDPDEGTQQPKFNDLSELSEGVDLTTTNPLDEEYPLPFIEAELPKGSVPLNSCFYVERNPYESKCYQEISKPGAVICIKSPKKMGKTSLLNRILAYASLQNYQTILIDFQQADEAILTDINKLLRWLCGSISRQLKLEIKLDSYWNEDLGSKMSCTLYFQEYLLEQFQQPLILALEEVNKIIENFDIAKNFLALLRSWHEKGKINPVWQKLRLVLVQSTEEYIPLNINQSLFNVGLEIDLPPFHTKQVQQLAKRHDLQLSIKEINLITDLVAGHPYLVRLMLYHLATQKLSLQKLIESAATDTGIYHDHLHRLLWQLQQHPNLTIAFKQLLCSPCPITLEQVQAFKLKSMGLVRLHKNQVTISCELYRRYFSERLLG